MGTLEINWQRVFNGTGGANPKNETKKTLSLDPKSPYYRIYLNWGVFQNDSDTNTANIFGSMNKQEASNFTFYTPTMAVKLAAGAAVSVTLASLL